MAKHGPQKWCPKCETWRVIEAVKLTELGEEYHQRIELRHENIRYFRRGQQCQTCYHCWLSAEVPERLIDELVERRIALRDIKKNAEAFSKESEIAAESLARLSKSLSDLTELK
ncbi:hypothetical protein [Mycolicibacterium lutetiense]|uniref:Transposase n=1 Tax=Mycolicibacterium lutetiense TaxID=1641992 RepID=A0ABS5A0B3_9MYCO|nr:hypothetical protein [Mycolicibacterium lutetiense]MBP2455140.1 hypothetical protein [Mycolicibacterium lutetiense]